MQNNPFFPKLFPLFLGIDEGICHIGTSLRCTGQTLLVLLILTLLQFPEMAHCSQLASDKAHLSTLIDILQKRYDQTTAISARFRQQTYAPGDPKGVYAQGIVYFKRPHLMRWEYEKPAKQLIVTSGINVYIYEIEAKQVTIIPRDQFLSSEISKAFFFGRGDLRHDFKVVPAPKDFGDPKWSLCLIPKRQVPQLKRLFVTLDSRSHLVSRIVIEDQMGGRTVIEFSDIRINPRLSPSLFRFSIPEGVEVYRGQ